tara:strand:+ start:1103 stop:1282 length:180 start_codon:yes stop_codon:yes gene_type:complete
VTKENLAVLCVRRSVQHVKSTKTSKRNEKQPFVGKKKKEKGQKEKEKEGKYSYVINELK